MNTPVTQQDRFRGALFGLAYGDAISFPAQFQRFQAKEFPRKRHDFLWRTNTELDRQGISRVMIPFTHRLPATLLEPGPTDDTEFAVLTLRALLNDPDQATASTFLKVWRDEVLPNAESVHCSFSERAAIENLKRGMEPPATGNDNPLHYEDSAVARAVPIGLYCAGDPDRAAELAELDAQISQGEDGIYGAQAMAAAIAALASGGSADEALSAARSHFPTGSWIAHLDGVAQASLREADSPEMLALLLMTRVINTVYSYGNAAPETVPAALALFSCGGGKLNTAVATANLIGKSADSLPAMVGALCGAYRGIGAIGSAWQGMLRTMRGVCLPFLAGVDLEEYADRLYARINR